MKTTVTFFCVMLCITVSGYNWTNYGPAGIHANNILFGAGSNGYSVICSNSGLSINNGTGYSWNTISTGLSVWEAIDFDAEHILFVMGNGSYSDGIYKFNLVTNTFEVVDWCYIPTFIRKIGNTYYVGTRYNGLLSSSDGITWISVPYFQNKGCTAIDCFGQHIVVTQENNIYATYYSDDEGNSWNQSLSNVPIHDLAFGTNGKLFGVFTGASNSSGLYLSYDFGHTWNLETYVDNMNTVGFDVVGNIFTGFHGPPAPSQGVAIYDTNTSNFSFLNGGLPNTNIQKFRINPVMSSIAIFACTDTGVYFSNNYLTSIHNIEVKETDFNIYPIPAHDYIVVEIPCKSVIEIMDIEGNVLISEILSETSKLVDIKDIKAGIYMAKIYTLDERIVTRRIIVL